MFNTTKKITRLQYITQDLEHTTHQELVKTACLYGIEWIQLRVKNKSFEEYLSIANEVKSICEKHKVKLIINDNVAIAKAVNAQGVHLGKTDMDITDARKQLGNDVIIGGTANTFDDIVTLVKKGADYIGLGPFKFTSTKSNLSPILGLQGYREIIEQLKTNAITTPIIAIGGIQPQDVSLLMNEGIYGIAVSSAITLSNNKIETIKEFKINVNQIGIEKQIKTGR